jgi:hypothetical protein
VHREAGVAIVEPGNQPERDPVLTHRIDERAAELAVLRGEAQRPARRVDHAVERLLDLPHLLHAELPLLRVLGPHVEVADGRPCQVALRSLGQHGRLGDQIRARLEVGQLATVAVAPLVARPDAHHTAVLHEELGGGGLAQHIDAGLLRLLAQPPPELRDRGHVVAVVPKRGRHRLERKRPAAGEEIRTVLLDRAVRRPLRFGQVGEQPLHRRGPHHRARQQVRPGRLALLDERDRHLAERLQHRLVLGQQLGQPDRAGEPGGPAADDHHADLDPLVLGIRGCPDELLGRVDGRRELDGGGAHLSPSWPSPHRRAWAGSC